MKIFVDSFFLTQRHLRSLARQPYYVAFTLVQPVIWLVLYGQLFKRVVELPGFNAASYITFLTPGIIVMTAIFGGGWSGMGVIREINAGTLDRFLVSPCSRGALMIGRLAALAVTSVVQSFILLALGWLLGARFNNALLGFAVLIGASVLLAASIGALSNAMAVTVRREESVIAASNFILMPLLFLSPVFLSSNVMPHWINVVSRFNPVNWSVEAGRAALSAQIDPHLIAIRLLALLIFAVACGALATRAFNAYQRSI